MNPFPQPSRFIHPATSLPPIPPPSRPPSTKSDVSSIDYVTEEQMNEIDEELKGDDTQEQQDKVSTPTCFEIGDISHWEGGFVYFEAISRPDIWSAFFSPNATVSCRGVSNTIIGEARVFFSHCSDLCPSIYSGKRGKTASKLAWITGEKDTIKG